ncbi:hypothetical protein BO221_34325 [Archangium sp. Cb G35]|uniref:hypothetical protein n=1 Tax=Archangium sp. Cb G35 TaxID=1920190 RepID=UPI0009365E85|nr:hypothetical protein [Archangium sp. Cb G35]OJT19464.1 hypothetical protein BO221_34325 [Archangium sp. Cb G35]
MAGRDPNRRIYGTQPLRRVGTGQDRFDKEALEGAPESPVSTVREQRQMNAPLNPERKSFAAALERLGTPAKKK